MARTGPLKVIVVAGALIVLVSGFFLLRDWAALIGAYAHFETLARQQADLRQLFLSESLQNVYRINCFAEGVGVLSGAILTAIGWHGLCLVHSVHSPQSNQRDE